MNGSSNPVLRRVSAGDSSVRYFGKWEKNGGAYCTKSAYSRCYFTFYGDSVQVYARTGADQGICEIWLDGEFRVFADCYAGSGEETCIFQTAGIPGKAVHNLAVTAKREKNEKSSGNALSIAGFAALQPADYPAELKRLMNTEYAAIKSNLKIWKPAGEWQPAAYEALMPQHGVVLLNSLVRKVYDMNIKNIKYNAGLQGYCEGKPSDLLKDEAPGPGWSGWLPGSNEGRMLAGAAGALCWEEDPELRKIVNRIIGDIKARMRDDGYFNYYPEERSYVPDHTLDDWVDETKVPDIDGILSERKNYDRVFWTRGMLAAMAAGNPDAPVLLRRMYDWFNSQEKHLTHILLGGNATNGAPGGPLVYHSPAGKPDDIITSMRYFDQDYWFEAFAERQPMAFSHYPGERPHCYALLPVEALADEYTATGDPKYYNALMGAWDIYHRYYKHTGGPTAICEMGGPYPPGTYFITTGHNGETCGSVFWGWINQRLVQLYPDEERYISQIEEVIYNTLCNCRDQKGHTRYHISLHGKKNGAANENTCCQVSSTMAISSIPQYIYLTNRDTVFVNLFIPSRFESGFGRFTLETDFPESGKVTLKVEPAKGGSRFNISLRLPGWADGGIAVLVNGKPAGTGLPGSRFSLNRQWNTGDTVSFAIPYGFKPVLYTGTDQAEGNLRRYTMMYGPILMALKAAGCKDAGTIPHIRMTPEALAASLKPDPRNALHFPVPGTDYSYMPYWDAGEEGFSCVPIIEA
ncbi:MAG: glycoside hydrolase family 127 protein [Treponema sp.]|jgi:hypothetical protein|nr:glycoside hydrolase family 127 protein [Treponema sp.]